MCCICGLSTTRSCCLFSPSRATKTTTHTMRTFTVRELESPLSNPLRLLMVPAPQERMNRLAHHPALCFRRCHASTSSKPPGTRHLCTGSTASPSPTLMWATSVRKRRAFLDRPFSTAPQGLLSLSLSLSRARAGDQTNPTPHPGCPAPCRSIESCARSAPLHLSFRRRGPTTRSLLGSRTKDLLSFFTTRCLEELASKKNELLKQKKFTFEVFFTHASSHFKTSSRSVQDSPEDTTYDVERCKGGAMGQNQSTGGGGGKKEVSSTRLSDPRQTSSDVARAPKEREREGGGWAEPRSVVGDLCKRRPTNRLGAPLSFFFFLRRCCCLSSVLALCIGCSGEEEEVGATRRSDACR